MGDRPDRWLSALRAETTGGARAEVVGAVARHLAGRDDALVDAVARRWPGDASLSEEALPPRGAGPGALGSAYEALADDDERRRGLHYTPPALAARLVAIALSRLTGPGGAPPTVCDPSCGGGAFLLAAGARLAARLPSRRAIVERHLVGVDLDPLAVEVAATALILWSGDARTTPRVLAADALAGPEWPHRPDAGFDAVVGNPPFQSQLATRTARTGAQTALARRALGDAVATYADTAALFLLRAARSVRPGGRVVLVQPQSVLAGRDGAAIRAELSGEAPLEGLWVCDEPVFSAHTRVCAPVLRRRGPGRPAPARVRRWYGPEVQPAAPADPVPRSDAARWSSLAADLRATPVVALPGPPLAELAGAGAGFRDQYYGLAPHVREATGAAGERPLVTSGLLDPAHCGWGEVEARFAKRRWRAPVVDPSEVGAADPALGRWLADRLVPKVLVATQTRVVEAAADVEGRWVPSTPVIAVPASPERIWHVLAALLAPPVSAWALRLTAGTALSPDAVKLSAAQVRAVPGPCDQHAWDDGAAAARRAQGARSPDERRDALLALGRAMTAAHRIRGDEADHLVDWWARRLERRRGALAGGGGARSDNAGDAR
ncbi:MAG: N-6 DNA methylase [Acidimicrobiales bacterium]|nr:N-6 DNA methylase [Acidimicrobiales bacterium]